MWLVLKRTVFFCFVVVFGNSGFLTSETVQGTSLALQSVHHVHSRHRLPLGVFGVRHGISDDVLKENLEYTSGFFVDQTGDTLDTSTAGQSSDGGLGDTLDVVAKYLTVSLSASLSETLSSFTSSRHVFEVCCVCVRHKLLLQLSSAKFRLFVKKIAVAAPSSEMRKNTLAQLRSAHVCYCASRWMALRSLARY